MEQWLIQVGHSTAIKFLGWFALFCLVSIFGYTNNFKTNDALNSCVIEIEAPSPNALTVRDFTLIRSCPGQRGEALF